MADIENLFQLIETKLDQVEEIVDELEENGEDVGGIRRALSILWNEIDEIS